MQNCSRWSSQIYILFSEKNRLDIACESSVMQQTIHMQCQALFVPIKTSPVVAAFGGLRVNDNWYRKMSFQRTLTQFI